jgi:hypothetical protein
MSRTRFLLLPLVMLVIIALLIGGGWAVHRVGWTEGYAVGTGVATGGTSVVPYAPVGLSYLALFLMAGLAFLVLITLTGKLLCLWAFSSIAGPWAIRHGPWKAPVGPHGEQCGSYWRSFHRHGPAPWWGWEQADEEKSGDAEPGAEGAGCGEVS